MHFVGPEFRRPDPVFRGSRRDKNRRSASGFVGSRAASEDALTLACRKHAVPTEAKKVLAFADGAVPGSQSPSAKANAGGSDLCGRTRPPFQRRRFEQAASLC
ncbi:MAG TPA: hypothetical protein PKC65_02990 [Pyrinomonadaceae bacterium]|nr:hypothetical protein [Pyrinomonadaceae bacterium]